jgi:hypothetical protein
MATVQQIANHFREVFFGGNWTSVNLKDQLADLTWEEASAKVHNLNTITALVYHIHYYVQAVLKVLRNGALDAHDKYSFDHSSIQSREDWEEFLRSVWAHAEEFASLVEQFPEQKLWTLLAEEKYGHYYRNIHGIIEHTHYHLGQIVLIKKILRQQER